jgi:ectoine hydroxylase-related dioxygenase (phytanoyl-CoA dioxygenase family)
MNIEHEWNQDYTFLQCTSPNLITAWISLVDTTEENGCMRYIPGTQEALLTINEKIVGNQVAVPTKAGKDKNIHSSRRIGQINFHHCMTVHGSGANTSNTPRISIVVYFIPENPLYVKDS